MTSHPKILISTIAICIVGVSVSSTAQAPQIFAPLPDGYSRGQDHLVLGLYAEVGGLSSTTDEQEIDELRAVCTAAGKQIQWRDRDKADKGIVRIYRTRAAVVVIRDAVYLTTDRANCTASYTVKREITARTGLWKYEDVPYFRSPNLSCGGRRLGHLCSQSIIAGIRATCINNGDGLVGSIDCVSQRKDLTQGLLLAHSTYVDDGSAPTGGWALDRVEPTALIDPEVFRQE